MPSTPTLQCLFCHHLNPAGASFCNDCGSQLHLQPCDHCGSINKRSARSCYKCHAIFTLSAVPGLESAILDDNNEITNPALNDVGTANEHEPQPESAVQALSTLHHELRPERPKPLGRGSGVATRKAVLPNRFRADSHSERRQADEATFSERIPAATRSRYTWRFAIYGLLLAVITTFVYYYSGPSAQRTQKQPVKQIAPSVSREPMSSDGASPVLPIPVEVASEQPAQSEQTGTTPKTAISVSGVDEGVPLAPTGAGTAMKPPPISATDTEIPPHPPPISRECPEAVATLGLCSPIPIQERP